jgi:OOP family OmpA-OmpF porin
LTPGSDDYLQQAAEILAGFEGMVVEIKGHADDVGAADANLQLSQARAQAVVDALIRRGVDAGILQAVGHGEAMPIADNATEEGRAANRRVEIELNGGPGCNAPSPVDDEGASLIGLLAMAGWRSKRGLQQQQEQQRINW